MQVESPTSYTLIFVTTYYWQKPVARADKLQSICRHMVVFQRDNSVFDMSCSLSVLILSHTSSELLGPD